MSSAGRGAHALVDGDELSHDVQLAPQEVDLADFQAEQFARSEPGARASDDQSAQMGRNGVDECVEFVPLDRANGQRCDPRQRCPRHGFAAISRSRTAWVNTPDKTLCTLRLLPDLWSIGRDESLGSRDGQ